MDKFTIFSLWKCFYIAKKKQQVLEVMPETLKTTYPSTRCFTDCTNIFCRTPSLLPFQRSLCSGYTHYFKYKSLFGIALCGAKSFIKQLYVDCNSHKEIFRKSFNLSRNPWKDND